MALPSAPWYVSLPITTSRLDVLTAQPFGKIPAVPTFATAPDETLINQIQADALFAKELDLLDRIQRASWSTGSSSSVVSATSSRVNSNLYDRGPPTNFRPAERRHPYSSGQGQGPQQLEQYAWTGQ